MGFLSPLVDFYKIPRKPKFRARDLYCSLLLRLK